MRRTLAFAIVLLVTLTGCGQDPPAEPTSNATPSALEWLADYSKPGDVLVSINGQAVKSRDDVIRIMGDLDSDSATVEVVLDRRGRLFTLQVDRPPR